MSAKLNGMALSRRSGMLAATGLFGLLLGMGGGCNQRASGPLSVPLKFTPNDAEPLSGSLSAADMKVHLETIKDERENKEAIGENREGATPVPVYAAEKTPAEFVHEVLETELKNFGADLTD